LPCHRRLSDHPDVDQKRQFPRFALEASVKLTAGGRTIQGRTANLSRGGLCAMVSDAVPTGSRVDVELALVFENDSLSEPLQLVGRVVWCTPVEARYQVGLAFLALAPDASKFLDVFLKYLQEGKRARAV
jgi:c-di-GMP-binding flagellar brake protein YcgR